MPEPNLNRIAHMMKTVCAMQNRAIKLADS